VQKQLVANELTERHARALLKLGTEEEQLCAISKIAQENLTVTKTEELIEETIRKTAVKKGKTIPFKAYIRDIRILTNSIQENLEIVRRSGMETVFEMQQTDTGYNIMITLSYANGVRSKVV
jgi:ParB family chromosome partitioning protein